MLSQGMMAFSALLQVVATVMSVRLIRVTGHLTAWILLSAVMLLQAFRRIFVLVSVSSAQATEGSMDAALGLLISAGMLATVWLIKGYFESMAQREEAFRTVADYTYDWELWEDAAGHLLYCSPSCKRITGHPAEAFMTDPGLLARLIHPEDLPRWNAHRMTACDAAKALPEAELTSVNEFEFRMLVPDRGFCWISHVCHPVLDAQGVCKGYRSSNRDITERKQQEAEHRKLEDRIAQVQKLEALGVLVAGVAHHINNVLMVIMGTASLREDCAPDTEDQAAYGMIGKACRRGREVVKALIEFARPVPPSQTPIELHALINEARAYLGKVPSERIEIVGMFAEEPLWIRGDAWNLIQAFVNLGLNAVDAMPNGGTLIFRTAIAEQDWAELCVEDSGAGMTPEVLTRVLDPFFTTKAVDKAMGLGLSMTHGMVKAHGGTLDIASSPGHGTTVKLRFPRIPAPGEP